MRFGSHKVPLRLMIAVISLSGLGIAATIPTEADEMVDPIITESISKVDDAEPSVTELPPELDVAPMSDDQMDESQVVDSGEPTPRQILPQSTDAVVMPGRAVVEQAASPSPNNASSSDPVVTPVMTDTPAQPLQQLGASQSAQMPAGVQAMAGSAGETGGAIILALDHARVMRMVGDVSTIIIGNPAIADVSMPDPQTVVLTGKSYGETNMVMLDDFGNILAEQMLRVTVRGQSLVSVYRGVQRTTLSCSPTCQIRPTPGDSPELVQAGLSAFQARNAAAVEAANSQ